VSQEAHLLGLLEHDLLKLLKELHLGLQLGHLQEHNGVSSTYQ
jgi:hypothetical protein